MTYFLFPDVPLLEPALGKQILMNQQKTSIGM